MKKIPITNLGRSSMMIENMFAGDLCKFNRPIRMLGSNTIHWEKFSKLTGITKKLLFI